MIPYLVALYLPPVLYSLAVPWQTKEGDPPRVIKVGLVLLWPITAPLVFLLAGATWAASRL